MAAPSHVATTSNETSGASIAITTPSYAAGDMMVALLSQDTNVENSAAPDGSWTRRYTVVNTANGDDGTFAVWTKTATGSESASYTFTFGQSTNTVAIVGCYRPDVGSTIAIDVVGVANDNTAANSNPVTVTATGLTTSVIETRLLMLAIGNANSSGLYNGWTAPGSMVKRAESTNPGGWASCATFDEAVAAAGATGVRSATLALTGGLTGYVAALLALRNVSAGGSVALRMPLLGA